MNDDNDEAGRDRISSLPESVLHVILYYLDLKPAIQTCILSTKWRYVWRSLPCLNFRVDQFYSSETKSADGFLDFVDNVLNHRDASSSILSFRLSCYRGVDQSDLGKRLSRWILTSLKSNVEDLYVFLVLDVKFKLPQSIFKCKSLTSLEILIYRKPNNQLNLPVSMDLPELKSLVLGWIQFVGNDDIPNKIFTKCPVLESLEFNCCNFPQPTLDINAPQLKHLAFRGCDKFDCNNMADLNKYIIKLNAPNLVSLCCDDNMFKDYGFVNVSALVKAEINDEEGIPNLDDVVRQVFVQRMFKILRALRNVETLTLSTWFIEVVSGVPDLLKSKAIQFCNLRCLTLAASLSRDCINAMTHLLKISPNIESLLLKPNKDFMEEQHSHPVFDEVRFDLAKTEGNWETVALLHLKFVKIRGVRGCLGELQFLRILLKKGVVLEKLIIESRSREELPREFVQQLLTSPRASSNVVFLAPKNLSGDVGV